MATVSLGESGLVIGLALVLAVAASAKLTRPAAAGEPLARALGGLELVVAVLALVVVTRLGAGLEALMFAGFTVAHARAWSFGAGDCGCFGEESSRAAPGAVVLTGASACLAGTVALTAPPSLLRIAEEGPARAVLVTILAALGAAAWRWGFRSARAGSRQSRLTTASERLVNGSASFLEHRLSRRTALVRIAVAGSALCVAPLRYLLYPGSALAAILPGDCSGGLCTDGYTAFCCEINQGLNSCPSGTYPGGWWMCTDYTGTQLCAGRGVRYYVDCNALPDQPYPGGCRCADDTCAYRRVACNIFRYGQCNTQVLGTTAVVCRMVVCENPGLIPALNCSTAVMVDDSVCAHEAACLEPMAVQLPGAGGV
ncbi:MAG: MauE/DoxX family redox-associated membrane protein [Solirubrobacteraceae bacterium]